MRVRRWFVLVLGSLVLGGACVGGAAIFWAIAEDTSTVASEESGPEIAPELLEIRDAGRAIRRLHVKKRPAQPGEWLDRHFELGQTFHAYHGDNPNRPTSQHTTLYIQPLGELKSGQAKLVDAAADILCRWYGVPVRVLDPVPLEDVPVQARRISPAHGGVQITTSYLLGLLMDRRPDDAVAVLGLTTGDLWPGKAGWSYVLGQASLNERVGVWSLYRMGDPETEYRTCLQRTLKTAVHETGHMFGIRHCVAFECGMNGSNHQEESDARPLWFCPEDEMKVWWASRIDPVKRYDGLIKFANAHGLDAEARFWRASRAAVNAVWVRAQVR
jgi:archaemetzincin